MESLKVNRAFPEVPPPIWDCTYSIGDGIDVEKLKLHFLKEGRLTIEDAVSLVDGAATLFRQESNLLSLEEPIAVVGDIHGQFYDLVKLLEVGGALSNTQYLFLGDYVDRGCFSCEVVLLLCAAKLSHPHRVFMLRGNHETRHLTTYFNFKDECIHKYDEKFYNHVMLMFDCLPIAAMVGSRFFCVHGGLSPDVSYVKDVELLHRFREPPPSGPMCDLLWSDPHWDVNCPESSSELPSQRYEPSVGTYDTTPSFTLNEQRGCSFIFNFAALKHFITTNKLLCVIRAHEAQPEGYCLYRAHPATTFPTMMSIFSAPNYCDTFGNKGAIAYISDGQIKIRQFYSSPHPYVLPNFMNAFQWSMPFVIEKTEEIAHFLGVGDCDNDAEISEQIESARSNLRRVDVQKQRGQLRKALLFLGAFSLCCQ